MVDTFDKLLLELERCLMGTSRLQFTDDFKRESVGLLASSGRPLSQIARELGIAASMPRSSQDVGDRGNAGSTRRSNAQAAILPARGG
jgi:transposase